MLGLVRVAWCLGLWIVVRRDTGETMRGCGALLPVSTAAALEPRLTGLVEPLVALVRDAWGHGYAREALIALVEYARTALGLQQLAGVTEVPNTRSDRMLRSAGFEVLSEVEGPRYRLRTYRWRSPGLNR